MSLKQFGLLGRSKAAAGVVPGGVFRLSSRGFAENPNDIAKRIASTKSIQKITKSMKMVSAAKLRGDTNRLMDGRAFGRAFNNLFEEKKVEGGNEGKKSEVKYKKPLYVLISSDRGLCGGVNSFGAKRVKLMLDENAKVLVLGDKGTPLLQRTHSKNLVGSVGEVWKTPMNFAKALGVAERISILQKAQEFDVIRIVYNKFINSISYDTQVKDIPVFPQLQKDSGNMPSQIESENYELEYESSEEAMRNVFEYGLAVTLYGCCLENATSEQSSRMTAMDNASKNASEMVDSLTVKFNRARQARITTELIEIISGAESLKG